MANRPDDAWDALRALLPRLREPVRDGGLEREEVRALLALIRSLRC
jgi:hypothetical protein